MTRLLLLALACAALGAQAETGCTVTAAEWSRPRSAAMVRALPGVHDCVQAWLAQPERRLILISTPGEEGGLWASELRAVGSDKDLLLLRLEAALVP